MDRLQAIIDDAFEKRAGINPSTVSAEVPNQAQRRMKRARTTSAPRPIAAPPGAGSALERPRSSAYPMPALTAPSPISTGTRSPSQEASGISAVEPITTPSTAP